ncbi:MAG TPA: GTPase HflX [Spirochaetota bacterium]|nr:GTPase HflX [Spirochaetota bacterium]
MDASVNRILPVMDERAYLIGVRMADHDIADTEDSLRELSFLVLTAGGIVVDRTIVRRNAIDASTIIGKGHLETLKKFIAENSVKLVVFDLNMIRPAQIRNLEDFLKCRVIGRTEVILDIFAKRAKSAESKIQVELAQLKYLLPRLKGLGEALSRLGGGIGTRGPGEKMLETDRRHIQRKINTLNDKLKKISKHRSLTRRSREGEIRGAIVGYTNAGKSTLLNNLAKDDLFVENRLFATLDAYTRSVYLDETRRVLLTDTVGFIRNLPANLVESFKSTLEEISNAHFIIHVVDIHSRHIGTDIDTVEKELHSLGCLNKPSILFFNKSDVLQHADQIEAVIHRYPGALTGSALTGDGMNELKEAVSMLHDEEKLRKLRHEESIRANSHLYAD